MIIGDIYRAIPMGQDTDAHAALVLITDSHPAKGYLTVALLSPDMELGTSNDLILRADQTGLAYDLLAESDIFGYIWAVQLDRKVGQVDRVMIDHLLTLRGLSLPVAGPPVVERTDPRWNFKLQELKRLQKLTANCTYELTAGGR